jgi:hypothetical protein
VQLRDLSGRQLSTATQVQAGKISLKVGHLAEGVYFAYLVTEGFPRVLPFVIKR